MKKLVENVLSRRQKELSQLIYKNIRKKGTFMQKKIDFPSFFFLHNSEFMQEFMQRSYSETCFFHA